MTDHATPGPGHPPAPHAPHAGGGGGPSRAIICGFGVPGRSVADALDHGGVGYTVIEVNMEVVERCRRVGRRMVCGDARDVAVLEQAGIATAELVALMMPADNIMLEALDVVRARRPDVRILSRAMFTSTGMEAQKRGASGVVVAELVVAEASAREALRLLDLPPGTAPSHSFHSHAHPPNPPPPAHNDPLPHST